jgi:uncharacterized protein YaeQ
MLPSQVRANFGLRSVRAEIRASFDMGRIAIVPNREERKRVHDRFQRAIQLGSPVSPSLSQVSECEEVAIFTILMKSCRCWKSSNLKST